MGAIAYEVGGGGTSGWTSVIYMESHDTAGDLNAGQRLPDASPYKIKDFPLTRKVLDEQTTAVVNVDDPGADGNNHERADDPQQEHGDAPSSELRFRVEIRHAGRRILGALVAHPFPGARIGEQLA